MLFAAIVARTLPYRKLGRYAVPMPEPPADDTPWLLTGASAAVGQRLSARLQGGADEVIVVSRRPPAHAMPRTRWLQHDLYRDDASVTPERLRVLSAGPLDGFVAWSARAPWRHGTRVVALSSLSAETKYGSPLPEERALAQRLRAAEATLRERARERGWGLTLLRVSLIYDPRHRHLSLDRLVELAQRLHFLPLPADATGLRQPLHADDLARAMLALARYDGPVQDTLRLPGGETLPFVQMVRRYLQAQAPTLRVRTLPVALARLAEFALRAGSARHRLLASQLHRSRDDLVVATSDWDRIGLQPRLFLAPETGLGSLY